MISKVLAGHEIVLDSPSHTFTIKFESKNKNNVLFLINTTNQKIPVKHITLEKYSIYT